MFNTSSPLFVNLLLGTIYVLLAVAAGLTVWSAARSAYLQRREGARDNGIPARRIAWVTALFTILLLVLTFALGSTKPMTINGRLYDDAFWLRTSDMLISSSLVLIAVASLCVLACTWHLGRRLR